MASRIVRRDQENLIHAQQTAAAGKPLNQSVRALAPKTPGNSNNNNNNNNNNGGRRRQHDENAQALATKGEKSKLGLATPAPNTTRAPLGAKTTNAKARAFATPAPLNNGLGRTQRRSASGKKHKLKIHHQIEAPEAEPAAHETEDEEPDVEICPPKVADLPDLPDDDELEPGKRFPQFDGENYSRGYWGLYANPVGDDGICKFDRDEMERDAQLDKVFEDDMQRDADDSWKKFNDEFDEAERFLNADQSKASEARPSSVSSAARRPTLQREAPGTQNSRNAASALSKSSEPRFLQSTASTRARGAGPVPHSPAPASKATIGYARGRQVSATLKDAKSKASADEDVSKDIEDNVFVKERRMLDELLQNDSTKGGLDDSLWESSTGKDWFQEQLESDFQLQMPADTSP